MFTYPDLIIKREENFLNNIEKNQNVVYIPNIIKQILIDFTVSIDSEYIKNKCYRNYQSKDRFLIIILCSTEARDSAMESQKVIQNLYDIDKSEHNKIIDFSQYLEFLNLFEGINKWKPLSEKEKKILEKFNKLISLASDSLILDSKFDKLIKLSEYFKKLLLSY